MNKREYETKLATTIATFFNNPVGYVRFAFADVLLDTWQEELLNDIEDNYRSKPEETLQYAISSGH